MHILLAFLNRMPPDEQAGFALRCGTSVGYLRKAVSAGQPFREKLAISIERESAGVVPCELLRPDVDWDYLRRKYAAGQFAPAGGVAHV